MPKTSKNAILAGALFSKIEEWPIKLHGQNQRAQNQR